MGRIRYLSRHSHFLLTADPSQSLTVVIDSLDTLLSSLHSTAVVYAFLAALLKLVQSHPSKPLHHRILVC